MDTRRSAIFATALLSCLFVCVVRASDDTVQVSCSNTTSLCYTATNYSVSEQAPMAENSTVNSSCLGYMAALWCLALRCETSLNSLHSICPDILAMECVNYSLICGNVTNCSLLNTSLVNCSSVNTTMETPPTTTPPPFSPLSLQGLISIIVGAVVSVILMAVLLVCCYCCCRCCCYQKNSQSNMEEIESNNYNGIMMTNPVTQEYGDPIPISKPRLTSMDESLNGTFTVSNPEVDDKGLINSYLLTENDILELTSLLDGAVLPSNLFANPIVLKDGVFHTTFKCHYKKVYTDGTAFTKDAVTKIVKGYSTRSDLMEYLELVAGTKAWKHPNIMSTVGVVLDAEDHLPRIVRGYTIRGDVRSYVRTLRKSVVLGDDMPENLNEPELVRLCYEVSIAMQYLATNNCVHGNLKARNCLLDDTLNVKVADFCPVRDSNETGYLVSSVARWLAPEVFTTHKLSLQSDVWSYAIVCWEVFTLGRVPYHGMEIVELPHLLKQGYRLEQPMLSPQILYELMCSCWEWDPPSRPSALLVNQKITEMYQKYTTSR